MNLFDLNQRDFKLAAKQIAEESRSYPEIMTRQELPPHCGGIEIWRSNKFLCQIYPVSEEIERLSINRTHVDPSTRRWVDGITWDCLQRIKSEVGRGHLEACEVYPPDEDVVDVANIRHLFVFKTIRTPFSWKKSEIRFRGDK